MSHRRDASERTRTTCAVCDAQKPSVGIQFGAYACKACAAFFRRAVVHRQQFRCEASGACPQRPPNGKAPCRYCRFQRCLRSGMMVTAVQNACLHSVPAHDGTQLGRITAFRKSLFLHRIKAANSVGASSSLLAAHAMSKKFQTELRVMTDYFANIIVPVRTRYFSDSMDM
ncbi:CBN-NHR-71 protein, partial [Aphelenchoides avenae]